MLKKSFLTLILAFSLTAPVFADATSVIQGIETGINVLNQVTNPNQQYYNTYRQDQRLDYPNYSQYQYQYQNYQGNGYLNQLEQTFLPNSQSTQYYHYTQYPSYYQYQQYPQYQQPMQNQILPLVQQYIQGRNPQNLYQQNYYPSYTYPQNGYQQNYYPTAIPYNNPPTQNIPVFP